ncbi:uncharacterized protein LOC117606532 [Osmia lignaria lignaria]|uniref:uncharacterized protein LOC117606532 n=1 Tax=Osmia lignaria lignaria TaxID=1437193 RepID=UPI00402BCEFF
MAPYLKYFLQVNTKIIEIYNSPTSPPQTILAMSRNTTCTRRWPNLPRDFVPPPGLVAWITAQKKRNRRMLQTHDHRFRCNTNDRQKAGTIIVSKTTTAKEKKNNSTHIHLASYGEL